MNKAEKACEELRAMDELAAMDSPVHGMDPLPKLLLTVFYIFVTVSFNKYDITGLFFMILFPVVAYQIAGIAVHLLSQAPYCYAACVCCWTIQSDF